MGRLSIFNPSRHLISSFPFFYFIFIFFHSFSLSHFSFLSLPSLLQTPVVPPSQYLPKHYRDYRPKHAKMSFEEFTELMELIDAPDIQWVVEWWRILSMAHRSLKDNCVPLVRLRYCSYYFTCCITT